MTAVRSALVVVAVTALSSPLSAEVRVVQRQDGSIYVYNVGARSSSARTGLAATRADIAARDLDGIVARHAGTTELEPELVRAVIQVESSFNPHARSHKGAMGLMQIMQGTAAIYAVADPYDPDQNVSAGTKYLRRMVNSFGSLELALAAYNAGPEAVKRFGGVPPYPETRDYVEKVMRLYRNDEGYSLADSVHLRRGRKTYLRRDASGRLVMTTTPPGG